MEEDKIITEKDISDEELEQINIYKELTVSRLVKFLESLPKETLIIDPENNFQYKINETSCHTFTIEIQGSTSQFKQLVVCEENGISAIEINRQGDSKDEFLGLLVPVNSNQVDNTQIDSSRIRILGGFESFKIRLDSLINSIINSVPYTNG
jgi:hypothetical protein